VKLREKSRGERVIGKKRRNVRQNPPGEKKALMKRTAATGKAAFQPYGLKERLKFEEKGKKGKKKRK